MSRIGIWATLAIAYFLLQTLGGRHWKELSDILFGAATALAIQYWYGDSDDKRQDD